LRSQSESSDEVTELDLSHGKKDAFVLEVINANFHTFFFSQRMFENNQTKRKTGKKNNYSAPKSFKILYFFFSSHFGVIRKNVTLIFVTDK